MFRYATRRLLGMIPLLLGISMVVFGLIQAAPGGPESALLQSGRAVDPEVLEAYRQRLGLDDPVPVQYVRWLLAVVRGDLGISFSTSRPVAETILTRLPATVELMAAAFALAAVLSLVLGTLGAVKPDSWGDHLGTAVSFLGLAMPAFWLALLLQLAFGVWLGWFPLSGMRSVAGSGPFDHLAHLVLPAVVLSFRYLAAWSRYLRASLHEALKADYIRTARAQGLSDWQVVGRHAMRNALIPMVSVMALHLSAVVGGAVVTETVFAWPGLGRTFVNAMFARDYPLLMGILLVGSGAVVIMNLVADLVYGWLDPRIRYE